MARATGPISRRCRAKEQIEGDSRRRDLSLGSASPIPLRQFPYSADSPYACFDSLSPFSSPPSQSAPAASRSSGSCGSMARSELRSHRGVARSEARNNPTSHTVRAGSARSSSTPCTTYERDPNGRIKWNQAARREFQKGHPCPATGKMTGACPGYVVDHIVPLKCGDADEPGNMQWQTKEAQRQRIESNEPQTIPD